MSMSLDEQREHMRALIEAYDRVGVAHLQMARDYERQEAPPAFGEYNANMAHHRTMASEAFKYAEHYTTVLKRCIEKKFNV